MSSPQGRKCALTLAAAIMICLFQGCTYLKHRGEDAVDMLDVGVTWSSKPYLAIYGDCAAVTPIGWGYVDGMFAGWGGGQMGATRHYEKCVGLALWGHEEIGWGEFDKDDPATLDGQGVGILGIALPPYGRPAYTPACVHFLHLGWFGLVANLRYLEMLDFLLGWSTLDIACDDGQKLSKWPWQQ